MKNSPKIEVTVTAKKPTRIVSPYEALNYETDKITQLEKEKKYHRVLAEKK